MSEQPECVSNDDVPKYIHTSENIQIQCPQTIPAHGVNMAGEARNNLNPVCENM